MTNVILFIGIPTVIIILGVGYVLLNENKEDYEEHECDAHYSEFLNDIEKGNVTIIDCEGKSMKDCFDKHKSEFLNSSRHRYNK